MNKDGLYSNSKVNNYVQEIAFLPLIYIIYSIRTIKEICNHSILKTRHRSSDIFTQLSYTFIGILTINFYIYLGVEFEFFNYDFNAIVNEPYFILFYLKNFSVYLIFSIIIYFHLIFKNKSNFHYFKSVFILSIKLFNVFMPIIFTILIITINLSFYHISNNNMNDFNVVLSSSIVLIFVIMLLVFLILLLKAIKALDFLFKNFLLTGVVFFSIISFTIGFYILIYSTILSNISFNGLIHKYEFCKEVVDYTLFQNNLEPKPNYTFFNYRNDLIECQDMLNKVDFK